jgi:hypothetical protein
VATKPVAADRDDEDQRQQRQARELACDGELEPHEFFPSLECIRLIDRLDFCL